MVYKDENNINIINSYRLFFKSEEEKNILLGEKMENKLWVEKIDAILLNEYRDTDTSLLIQKYNDIKIVFPIHYNSIGKIYKDYKIPIISGYDIIRVL